MQQWAFHLFEDFAIDLGLNALVVVVLVIGLIMVRRSDRIDGVD